MEKRDGEKGWRSVMREVGWTRVKRDVGRGMRDEG